MIHSHPRRRHRFSVASTCALLCAALTTLATAPAAAQGEAPRETFSGRAQVTAVDLVIDVRDADGRVPADLGPEDFTVLEDGEEKQVVGVGLLAAGTTEGSQVARSGPVAVTPPSDDERLAEATWSSVVYVDQVLSSSASIRRATQMLAAQAGRLAALGSVEIVVADPQPRQVLPPTRSARLIEQTLLRLGREIGGRDAIRQVRRRFYESLRQQLELVGRGQGGNSAAVPGGGGGGGGGPGGVGGVNAGVDLSRTRVNVGRTTNTWAHVAEEHRLLVNQQDAMLAWAAAHLGEGPRALLLVNDGYDLDPRDFYAGGAENARLAAELNSTLQDYSTLDQFRAMTRSIAADGWTCINLAFGNPGATFSVASADVSGKGRMGIVSDRVSSGLASQLPTALASRPLDPLRNLADETGGELLTGASAIPGALERLGERVRLTYQVARLPDGELHRVEVRPRDRSWKVRAPEWSGSPAPQAAASARARRLIAGGVEAGGLPLEAAVGIDEEATGEDDVEVRGTLQARLALRELTAALPESSVLRVTFAVELPEQAPFVRHDLVEGQNLSGLDFWTYSVPVAMPPQAGKISVVVEELTTGVWGGALAARVAGPLPKVEAGRRTVAVSGGGRGKTRTADELGFDVPVDLLPDPKAVLLVPPAGQMHTGRVRFETLATRPDVERVEFRLDGERVELVGKAPFETRIDLGEVPRPRTVEAVALDAAGEELGRDSVVVNEGAGSFRVRLIEPKLTDRVGPVDVEAEVRLRDGDELDRVEIAWNNEPVATLHAPPFRQRVLVPPESPVGYVTVTAYLADGSTAEDVAFMNGPGGDERVEVQLVELFAVVTDPSGRPIRGLGAGDFQVTERDRRQRVEALKDGSELPLSLALMIDTSASMQDVLGDVAIAAIDFLYLTLGEDDRSMLVSFDSQPRLIQGLTGDREAVGRSLVKLRPGGYTALCDALVFSLVQMQSVKGRRALVLLSDGVGREERVGYATCLRLAQQVGIPIYAIILDRDGAERERSEKIEDVAAAVGGRSFYVRSLENLGDVYRTIREELSSQYLLTYYPSDTSGDDWRPVDVEVMQPGLTARTVAGYWP